MLQCFLNSPRPKGRALSICAGVFVEAVVVGYREVGAGEGALELGDGALVFLAALLVGHGLIVVAVRDAGAGAGDELHAGDGALAVRLARYGEAGYDGVLVARVGVPAEGPVAEGIEYVTPVVDLYRLQGVRVRAVDDVRARVDGGAAPGQLLGVHVVAALVAPVYRGDDELRPGLLQRRDAVCNLLRAVREAHGVDAYFKSALRLPERIFVAARVAYPGGVKRGLRVRIALLAVVEDVVVAERDEFDAPLGEQPGVLRRGAEGEVLVARLGLVREGALEVRHREIVVFEILLRLLEDIAEVVRRDDVLVGRGGAAVVGHRVGRDVADEAYRELLRRGLGRRLRGGRGRRLRRCGLRRALRRRGRGLYGRGGRVKASRKEHQEKRQRYGRYT